VLRFLVTQISLFMGTLHASLLISIKFMGFLTDTVLRSAAASSPATLIEGINPNQVDNDIRGCSVDLHVGDIYRPGIEAQSPGSASTPNRLQLVLNEGETAVIQTVERFKLDGKHAAFVLPVSSISVQGLLMTNPGHVDPGYEGHVHVTVINMGKKPFAIQPKMRFLRAFIYQLDQPVASPKTSSGSANTAVTQELLDKLSPDFLSVNARAASAAKKEVEAAGKKSLFWQFAFPSMMTVAAGVGAAWMTNYGIASKFEDRIKSLEEAKAVDRLKTLELNYPTEKRLIDIENRLKGLPPTQAKNSSPNRK
jgi:dCTP deaminase